MNILFHIGRYYALLARSFKKPEKGKIYFSLILREIDNLGINSLGIIFIISIFMGAVITLQTAYNIESPLVPRYLVGLTARDSMILEFSSTVVGLILAGKVGSNIASEIGTMRVTEQIDALEIMGINSAGYLIFPKIIASLLINPFLNILSIFIGITGGYIAAVMTNAVTPEAYVTGLYYAFKPFYISYSTMKTLVFAFTITSVSAYHGYYVSGGALEIGKASTRAVVYSSILILLSDVIFTQMMLA
jgi:phospholipid/cholesterol/gamma-HCH transport system permease protein